MSSIGNIIRTKALSPTIIYFLTLKTIDYVFEVIIKQKYYRPTKNALSSTTTRLLHIHEKSNFKGFGYTMFTVECGTKLRIIGK